MTTVPEDIPCSPEETAYREKKLNLHWDSSRSAPVPTAGASLRMTIGPEDIPCLQGDPAY
jgi:hypothetical protein